MQSRFETFVVRTQADTRYVAHLASLNDVDAGIISLLVRPNARRVGWFARDFLAAMGKRRDVSGKGRNDQEDLALVPVWLAVHRITDVILAGAEALTADHLADLMLILASSRVRLWLVCDQQLGSGVTDLADEWPMTAVDRSAFDSRFSTRTRAVIQMSSEVEWPAEVPFADFPIYLAEVRRLLPPNEARLVEAHYWREFDHTSRELAADSPTEESLSLYLRRRLGECVNEAAMITTLRAAQAAAFNAGWFVQADLSRLLASGVVDIAAVVNDPSTWKRLRAYRQPHRGAVCALTATGLDIETQRRIRIRDVASDGSHVQVDGVATKVPSGAEPFVMAQRLHRRISGAQLDDPFFASQTGGPAGARLLRQALIDAALELGVVLTQGEIISSSQPDHRWRRRLGVSIQSLTEGAS